MIHEDLIESGEWDCVAGDANSHGVKSVLLDGNNVTTRSIAVNISRGQTLLYKQKPDGEIDFETSPYAATGKLAVLFDGFAIGNYGPITDR